MAEQKSASPQLQTTAKQWNIRTKGKHKKLKMARVLQRKLRELPRMMTEVVPSPTSSSCVRLISIIDLAAGCCTMIWREGEGRQGGREGGREEGKEG